MLTPSYFAALADPTRFQIVTMLARRGRLAVAEIGREFSISAPAISQHLKVLKEAQVVLVEVQAQQRIYTINPEGIRDVEQWVNEVKQFWEQRLDALDLLLQEEVTQSNTNSSNNSTSIPRKRGKNHVK
ncbi:MAG: helix-turn-helix transcriptional regulator [Burkholderiales bacterium]|nr:helix-turn-helix transcriptional regulator [Burkholderiales bacterium]